MGQFIMRFLVAGGIMGVLDAMWLGIVASTFYKKYIGSLLLDKPNMLAAAGFYLIYTIGVVVFVLTPALEKGSWQHAFGFGALFGLVAYATYDLTNLATVKGFSGTVVLVDLLWGTFLTGVVSALSYWVIRIWLS